MKVLLINGSPRKDQCTFTALSECASALNANGIETEIYQLGNGAVHGCMACNSCRNTGKCVFDDANLVADKIAEADGVIIGSPVYFAGPNGALCALLDRVFASQNYRFAGKPGAAVVSARRGGASATFDRLNKYFTISQMPIVSSAYWNSVHGFTAEDVKKDLEGLQTMRILGNNMAWMIKNLSGTQPEIIEKKNKITNFMDGK